jgi:hypothetical protein
LELLFHTNTQPIGCIRGLSSPRVGASIADGGKPMRPRRRRVTIREMRQHMAALIIGIDTGRIPSGWQLRLKQVCIDEARLVFHMRAKGPSLVVLHLPKIRSYLSYATALHELGHIHGRYQSKLWNMPRYRAVTSERWAWIWARQNALIWTPAMEREAAGSLASYSTAARCGLLDYEQIALGRVLIKSRSVTAT